MENIAIEDRKVLVNLAKRYMEIAQKDEMACRKRLWKDLRDLKPVRPMMLFDTSTLKGFLSDYRIKCTDPSLRNVETRLVSLIRQYEQLGDDIVLEPYYRIAWRDDDLKVNGKNFGEIKVEEHGSREGSLAYMSNFPIKTPDDIKRLKPREFQIDKRSSLELKAKLEDIFKDLLSVKLANFDTFSETNGNQPYTGNNFIGITWDVFKLIGAENMMLWMYDYPDAVHQLCKFIVNDKKRFYEFMLGEKLLDFNSDNQFAGTASYGYVSDLPPVGSDKEAELKDLWSFPEAQEAQSISPSMFKEFFLPYIAQIANTFGLSYYGCCETITDRFEYIQKAIHNIRTVSISGWSDLQKAGEVLGDKYVYSRKPVPAYVSTEIPNWELVEKEAKETHKATRGCCVEVIFLDAYVESITPSVAAKWINIWKKAMEI